MSIRQDITVNWSLSPRIIEVAAPSIILTVQDLYDTIRSIAASTSGIDEPEIIDGSGKEELGGGILVGLTVKLLNAKVKFEDRLVSWVICSITGGNLVAVDSNGDSMSPIEPASFVTVTLTASSSATLQGLTELQQDITFIKQVDIGRWRIYDNQMILYDIDGITPLCTFDLKDKQGQPTETAPYERIPV